MQVSGRPFTVVGAGRSGRAAANLLARRGADVRLVEQRADAAPPEDLHPHVHFVPGTNAVREGDVAVLSPGIPEVSPVRAEIRAAASEVIGEVELFYRLCPAPVLAITGTDGKSTTTTMLGAICRAAGHPTFVGGNLGNPLCDGLDDLTPSHVVVAEISCFQLTTCVDFRPRVAVVTNIAEDHTDYHGSFDAYQRAKRRIWRKMTPADALVYNADDPFIAAWELPNGPRKLRFALRAEAEATYDEAERALTVVGRHLMARDELRLLGSHNVANALAAAMAALSWTEGHIEAGSIRDALAAYQPLPHRLEPVATVSGVRWVNDSKATNANAAAAGIRAVLEEGAPLVVLAGGSDKQADFTELGHLIRTRARSVILFGQTRETLRQAVAGPDAPPLSVVETLDEAVATARALAEPGDTVLLSPACASYDQFRSYVHRGEVFKALVTA